MTILLTAALWPLECSTILLSRSVCGDESTLDLGDRFLSSEYQQGLAERHPSQVASMMENRSDSA